MSSLPAMQDEAPRPLWAGLAGFAGHRPWRRVAVTDGEAWVAGYLHGLDDRQVVSRILAAGVDPAAIASALATLDGHWALAVQAAGRVVAAVDRLRSWPLLVDRRGPGTIVGPRVESGLSVDDIDPDQALACAMSGYTVGPATLYRSIQTLGPGQFAVAAAGSAPSFHTYHRFRPWLGSSGSGRLHERLAEATLAILQRTIDSLDGRQVVIPLSAGRDSRVIASGLHRLGYCNILCIAYGRPANREIAPSRAVAERLGLKWLFIPLTRTSQRRYFDSTLHRDFTRFADSLDAAPFLQDLPVMARLQETGAIERDAVVINGQAGDYITGNHIPRAIAQLETAMEPALARRLVVEQVLAKHYRLWTLLATTENDATVGSLLDAAISDEALATGSPSGTSGASEAIEFQNRQVKYVAAGQRTYDFLGIDWRLPLWDAQYMDFWERAPLSAKRGQRLFAEMLERENWGNVWHDIPVNPPTGMPPWLRAVRFGAKMMAAPLGKARWHGLERRLLNYWIEPLANLAAVGYARSSRDRRGARGGLAWHTELYLARHGLAFDGRPLRTDSA